MSDEHPLLTARHVDDLTEAARLLTATITRAELEAGRRHLEQLVVLKAIADHTRGLPALLEALHRHSNGIGVPDHVSTDDQ